MFRPTTSGESVAFRRRLTSTASFIGPNGRLGLASPPAPTHAATLISGSNSLVVPIVIKSVSTFKHQAANGRRWTHFSASALQDVPCAPPTSEATSEVSHRPPGSQQHDEASIRDGHDAGTVAKDKGDERGEEVMSSPPTSPPGRDPAGAPADFAYAPSERSQIRETWATLMRWSKRTRQQEQPSPIDSTKKVQYRMRHSQAVSSLVISLKQLCCLLRWSCDEDTQA